MQPTHPRSQALGDARAEAAQQLEEAVQKLEASVAAAEARQQEATAASSQGLHEELEMQTNALEQQVMHRYVKCGQDVHTVLVLSM